MNELLSALSLWLIDYFVVASALLAASALTLWRLRQPAHRMALAWGTMAGLTVLAIAAALPSWPRFDVRQWATLPSPNDSELLAPVVKIEEQLVSLPGGPQPQAAETPALLPTAMANPLPHVSGNSDAETTVWPTWFAWTWLVLAAATIGWMAVGAGQAWRLLWSACPSPLWVQTELARLVGKRRKPRLKTSLHIGSAVAIGALRPAILLPAEHVREDNRAGVQAALAHEWAHIRHGDLWLLTWQRILLPLLAAHPLFWLLRRQIRADQELLADVAAAGDRPVEYAEALLAWAKQAGPRPSAGLAALAMWENPQTVSRRIQMILDPKNPTARSASRISQWLIVLALAALGGGLSLLSCRSRPVAAQEAAKGQGLRAISGAESPSPTAQIEQVELVLTMMRLGKDGEKMTGEIVRELARHFGDEIAFDSGVCVVALPRQQVESAVYALLDAGQVKILAQPKLMTVAGRDAYFADGGELPSIRETDFGDRRIETVEYHSLRSLRIRPEVLTSGAAGVANPHQRSPAVVRLSVTRENAEPIDPPDPNNETDATRPRIIKRQLNFTANVPIGRTLLVWELKPPAEGEANLVLITPEAIHRVTREILAQPREPVALNAAEPTADPPPVQSDPPVQLQDAIKRQIESAIVKLREEADRDPNVAELLKENARLQKQINDLSARLVQLHSAAGQDSKDKLSDDEFLRRVSLDLMGVVPSVAEVKRFRDSSDPRKREALIDRMLADPKVADHWTTSWKDLLAARKVPATELKPDESAGLPPPDKTVTVFALRHLSSERAVELAKEIFKGNKAANAPLVADTRTNSIVFHGTPQEAASLAAILKVVDQPLAIPSGASRRAPTETPTDDYRAGHDLATQRQLLELDLQESEAEQELAEAELDEAKKLNAKLGGAISPSELRKRQAALRQAELRRQRTKILLESVIEKEKPAVKYDLRPGVEGMVPPKNLPERIWQSLGLKLEPVDDAGFKKLNSTFRGGLTVTDVRPDSPADDRGVLQGDILLGLDRWETRSLDNVAYVLANDDILEVGELSFHILRDGKVLVGRMPLSRGDQATPINPAADKSAASASAEELMLKIRLAEIDLLEAQLKLDADEKQLSRISKLEASNALQSSELDAAKVAVEQSKLAVKRAQTVLEGLKAQEQKAQPKR